MIGLRADGTVVCTDVALQEEVRAWEDVVAISGGDFHVLGLKADGTVLSAGYSVAGEATHTDGWKLW